MALPCALFSSSCEEFKPQEFVKQILKVSELPQPKVNSDCIESYEWFFETKYYSATINLCTTVNRTIGDKDFAESVQAFIHFFDPNVPSSFELAKAWLPYLNHIEPEVLMLVCNSSKHNDVVGRKITLDWCIQNGFELVELDPEHDEDEDNDFPETTGIARIIQALHAHTWSNLDMKNSPTVQSPYLRQMMKEQHLLNKQQKQIIDSQLSQTSSELSHLQHSNTDSSCTAVSKNTSISKETVESENRATAQSSDNFASETERLGTKICDSSAGAQMLDPGQQQNSRSVTANPEDILHLDSIDWQSLLESDTKDVPSTKDDFSVDEFEQLFMKLKVMKDRAENLPPDERKKYAEKVAISFWKAIGGEDDEIEGLDEDSD